MSSPLTCSPAAANRPGPGPEPTPCGSAVEPTRAGPQQVLPGMERSAVQAAAGREAEGGLRSGEAAGSGWRPLRRAPDGRRASCSTSCQKVLATLLCQNRFPQENPVEQQEQDSRPDPTARRFQEEHHKFLRDNRPTSSRVYASPAAWTAISLRWGRRRASAWSTQ